MNMSQVRIPLYLGLISFVFSSSAFSFKIVSEYPVFYDRTLNMVKSRKHRSQNGCKNMPTYVMPRFLFLTSNTEQIHCILDMKVDGVRGDLIRAVSKLGVMFSTTYNHNMYLIIKNRTNKN